MKKYPDYMIDKINNVLYGVLMVVGVISLAGIVGIMFCEFWKLATM